MYSGDKQVNFENNCERYKTMSDNQLSPPEADNKDITRDFIESLIGEIPGGSVGTFVFSQIIPPAYEKRLSEWREIVSTTLGEVISFQQTLIDNLRENEAFITIIIQATQLALRNHQKEKIKVLKNAVINSALGVNISEDLQLRFLHFIDELTPSHIRVLDMIHSDSSRLQNIKGYEELYLLLSNKFSTAISKDVFKLMFQDLSSRNLIRVSPDLEDFDDVFKSSKLLLENDNPGPMIKISSVGIQFLEFISHSSS